MTIGIVIALAVPAFIGVSVVGMALTNAIPSVTPVAALGGLTVPNAQPSPTTATLVPLPNPLGFTPTAPVRVIAPSPITLDAPPATESAPVSVPTATSVTAAPVTPRPTETLVPTAIPAVTLSPIPSSTFGAWTFSGVRGAFDTAQGYYRIVGEISNGGATTQQLAAISGQFFDAANQLIAGDAQVTDFWPQAIVPAGERVPFELRVSGIREAAAFTLSVESAETSLVTRSGFSLSGLASGREGERYCVSGELRNSGERLQESLVVVAILYTQRAEVVNFREYTLNQPYQVYNLFGEQALRFRICVPPPNTDADRYEVRAWGR